MTLLSIGFNTAHLTSDPVFRAIERWGHLSEISLHEDSSISIFRSALHAAGIEAANLYSGHSLRRGFTVADQFSQQRIEFSLNTV